MTTRRGEPKDKRNAVASRRKRCYWTPAQVALLKAVYANTPMQELINRIGRSEKSIYVKANALGLRKSAAYLAGPHGSRLCRGDNVGAAFRFQKGITPWNKGTHFAAGGRSVETRFKPGNVSKRWDQDQYVVGALRWNGEYVDIKLANSRWRPFHLWLWEQDNGPLPRGHAVVFRDRDVLNIELSNLDLVSRAELMRRNTIHNLPAPIKAAAHLLGQLKRIIHEKHRGPTRTTIRHTGGAARSGQADGARPRQGRRGSGASNRG